MPWIETPPDPSYPYLYFNKSLTRPRLPPFYFKRGYAFYQQHMDSWMKDLERENKEYWRNQSRYNKRKIFKPMLQTLGEYRVPIYYTYPEFVKKANKYSLRKRNEIKANIEKNRQQAIRKRIELNRQRAIKKRKFILSKKLNKF